MSRGPSARQPPDFCDAFRLTEPHGADSCHKSRPWDQSGVKVTSFISAAALEAASPVDLTVLSRLARDLEQRAHDVATMAARGVA